VLAEFVGELALDLGGLVNATEKARTKMLLDLIGVDTTPAEEKIRELSAQRLAVGQQHKRAKGYAESLPYNPDVGTEIATASDLLAQMQAVAARNAELKAKRESAGPALAAAAEAERVSTAAFQRWNLANQRLQEAQEAADAAGKANDAAAEALLAAVAKADEARRAAMLTEPDEDSTELQAQLETIESTNAEIRKNADRAKAQADAEVLAEEYKALGSQIEEQRAEIIAALDAAKMPIPGLTIADGLLSYKGQRWDCMSGSEQLIVATSIAHAMKPECGFVLIDKSEGMDLNTLREFAAWLEANKIQGIATRVSKGDECSVIIEDGVVLGAETVTETEEPSLV
jgi:DNA repair exonuclease SbcCD ATPase subunit